MPRLFERLLLASAVAVSAMATSVAARACEGAGVIIRIEGQPQDVQIQRSEGGAPMTVSRPRVLEVVCHADVIRTLGTTYVVLSIDGAGTVRVDHNISYTVPPRAGVPSLVGNAYRSIDEQVMPDMKRLPWNVRIKGAGDDFGFALPALVAGGQQLQAGSRSLLVRLVGGTAPYKVEIRDAKGVLVASQVSATHQAVLPVVSFLPGSYTITAGDSSPRSLDATFSVVSIAPPQDDSFKGIADPEIRVAAMASALARQYTATWSFEAEQELATAPTLGLDRDKVYELIENYSTD
jgi:hypothetical protein